MSLTITIRIDWDLLLDQKRAVLQSMDAYGEKPLDGLLELIDYIQDCGVQSGEPVAFINEEE